MAVTKSQYRIAFASIRGMNITLAREILRLVGSEREFFNMSETKLRYITQSKARIYSDEYRAQILAVAEQEENFMQTYGVHPLYFSDENFPSRLAQCDDAPIMLYTLGNLDLNRCRTIGIVGTRHATHYGIEFTRQLIDDLSRTLDNVVIISGLAYGIDIEAHRAAIQVGIPTVAVMATGLQTVYPADHRNDAQRMVRDGGMLITEYGHREPIHKGNFVARNRIVAGLCDCLVVAESANRGGALITANLAAGYNRDVLALPGRVGDIYSEGCNRLIAGNVANLITNAEDLCRAMRWQTHEATPTLPPELPMELNSDEAQIVDFLQRNEDVSLQQITAETGFSVSKLMSHLIDLEFRGMVMVLPGGRYRRVSN